MITKHFYLPYSGIYVGTAGYRLVDHRLICVFRVLEMKGGKND